MDVAQRKEKELLGLLATQGSVIIAYSGGVDSTYLAYAATRALGERALAVTAHSPSYPRSHREMALRVAREFGFRHRAVETRELENPDYASNPSNRCYYCKSELFDLLEGLRVDLGMSVVAYGVNTDDTTDFRPGHRAAEERRVMSPFLEVGLAKREIRDLSRQAGLPTAGIPASACLSSRIPYGMEVTKEKLEQIDRAEDALRELGFTQVRVRHHGDLARIEVGSDELAAALDPRKAREMSRALHGVGFAFVARDLDGYRTGSLNEALTIRPPAVSR